MPSGEVRRTGVKRVTTTSYRMPEAARVALTEMRAAQYDALQHVRVSMERIERAHVLRCAGSTPQYCMQT
jgi:pyruvate/2-oxoglutarate dehydrogenase complex dihydrolipoamide dehydrogenase (E3) component|eukprot:423878-Prymnesium_polylepis.3